MKSEFGNRWSDIIGQGIIFSAIPIAFLGVELNPKNDLYGKLKTQEQLDRTLKSLSSFFKFIFFWTIGIVLVMYGEFGIIGIIVSLIFNLIVISWVYFTYMDAFDEIAAKNNLIVPSILEYFF